MSKTFGIVLVLVMVVAVSVISPPPVQAEYGVVKVQLAILLDASESILSSNWDIMVDGLADAVENPYCIPQDGSVELTVVRFSSSADVPVGPVVITLGNAAPIAAVIRSISYIPGATCISCAFNEAAGALKNSDYFSPTLKQVINLVTDGNPYPETKAVAEAARNNCITTLQMTENQDVICAEAIGSAPNVNWLRDNIVFPQPGSEWPITAPDPPPPGWVRQVTDAEEFAETVCEKLKAVLPAILDHFKCYEVEELGCPPPGEMVELQDQFVTINATVEGPEFFCNPVEKVHDGVLTPISNPDHHLTVYNINNITTGSQPQTWQVEVDNQFGTQVLNVSDPVMLAVPTWKLYPGNHTEPIGLDHFLLYNATGPPVSVTVKLNDQFHLEPEVVVLAPKYFANPVQKKKGGNVTEVVDTEAHLVFYEIVGDPLNTDVLISNQFVRFHPHHNILRVTVPRLLAVPSEKTRVIPPPKLDHFKCYNVTGPYLGETVELQDQFIAIKAVVEDPEFFCNPVAKNHCGKVVIPIWNPDNHLTLYSINYITNAQSWAVNVSNQFGEQELKLYNPVLLAVPTQKLGWYDFEEGCWKAGGSPPVGLDHFLLYPATGPDLDVTLKLLEDQWHSELNVVVVRPVYFANPVQKTHDCVVTPIENPEAHLVFYKIVGAPYSTIVGIKNQFVSMSTLNVTEPYLLAVPSDKTGFAEEPICFIATAAYGTPMAEEIEILREFRDEYLLTNAVGRALVDVYYRVSPPMAEFITEHSVLKPIVRASLVPAVAMSYVVVNTTLAEKAAIIGLVVLVSVALAVWVKRRRGRGSEYT